MAVIVLTPPELHARGRAYRDGLMQHAHKLRAECKLLVERSRDQRAESRRLSIESARLQRESWRINGGEHA